MECRIQASNVSSEAPASWVLYIVQTAGGSLYTGITTDVSRRFAEHSAGAAKCARFLRGKGPLELVFQAPMADHSSALKYEYATKKLSKASKLRLISGQGTLPAIN